MSDIEKRKNDHLEFAKKSQVINNLDFRFHYEPLLGNHRQNDQSINFLGKKLKYPFMISSMTGGSTKANPINKKLARVARELGLAIGLGSCRVLLESDEYIDDFDMREILGDDLPLYFNLGISQIEQILKNSSVERIENLQNKLNADGLIVHVNPLQEYFQYDQGDKLEKAPIETLKELRDVFTGKLIVKEVGQGFGPKSLRELVSLGVDCIDLSGFGGTNFTKLESIRNKVDNKFHFVGHTCEEMIEVLNTLKFQDLIIISGGVNDPLDAFHLMSLYKGPSVIAQASNVLRYVNESEEALKKYLLDFFEKINLAQSFLRMR